jgi:hypothetical protein
MGDERVSTGNEFLGRLTAFGINGTGLPSNEAEGGTSLLGLMILLS